jgi:hypothetical protein
MVGVVDLEVVEISRPGGVPGVVPLTNGVVVPYPVIK